MNLSDGEIQFPHSKVSTRIVQLASGLPELADAYSPFQHGAPLDLLPVLRKSDFRAVRESLLARARSQSAGAIVLGSGGTTSEPLISVIPSGMFLEKIRQVWDPLDPDDVVMNLNLGAELGSMSPFFNALSHKAGAVSVPLGPLGDREAVDRWLPFFEAVGATTLAGTPTQISLVLQRLNETRRRVPTLKKIIWTGEAFSKATLDEVTLYGNLEIYGTYGSTETWVIGVSYPQCTIGTFHLVPYQHIEFLGGLITITCLDEDCINPVVRYQLGDRGRACVCSCGRAGAFTVEGRSDDQVKFLSVLFYPREPYEAVLSHPDVRAAQIVLIDSGSPQERMEVNVELQQHTDKALDKASKSVRDHLLGKLYRLAHEVHDRPERIRVVVVDRLLTNRRSMKTPYIIHSSSNSEG
ncbi:AMP-binding protein [Agrobacterium rhizogenes]|uniref:AMP-binding protein n=1 Tax=Rhizobium rhizogenes TaxID=359 RepID=UPI00115E32F4|nr:AMP-binding protein [Rhizobium rhizogenes]NTG05266.1 AMP-binding protein [Rhizobium rhizogenes]NTG11852.1 AMP-binding protein [Rhizobium rhizogenes]NTG16370.1 AMP-binding protein [Rhizobium rhizogenes]NTG23311.1 AMP-binding protein [Rhizobium rhizogenes]NTG32392.1 AMP-binding protein [Rhizobium rhizogenes]